MASELQKTLHDIGNELHVLLGNVEFIASGTEDAQLRESAADARASADRIRNLLKALGRQCRDK